MEWINIQFSFHIIEMGSGNIIFIQYYICNCKGLFGILLIVIQASPEENQEGNFGSEHSASPSQGSSQQQFLEVEANVDDSMDIQQQVKLFKILLQKLKEKPILT